MLSQDGLWHYRGKRVRRVRRMHFEVDGAVDRTEGEVEFEFEDGSILLCEGDVEGHAIRCSDVAWPDPFPEPLTSADQRFVEEHGRWRLCTVSGEEPWNRVVGQRVCDIAMMVNVDGRVRGLLIDVTGVQLFLVVNSDRTQVGVL